jgi:hypothetical protein
MKTKKHLIIPAVISAMLAISLIGCDDSGNAPTSTNTGSNPNIDFKTGSVFYYGTDSISQNGAIHPTTWRTRDEVMAATNYQGKDCYPISSVTVDTITTFTIQSQTLYVSYDNQSGIFYQWGVKKLFDPNQTESWDEVADFSKALGTSVSLFRIDTLFGQSILSANVSSTVQYDTTFTTTGAPGVGVSCYKVAVVADILAAGLSVGKVYLDYYIGYTPSSNTANPSGRIRVKLFPINLPGFNFDGVDQKLNRFTIP